jgi:hypothetical protein
VHLSAGPERSACCTYASTLPKTVAYIYQGGGAWWCAANLHELCADRRGVGRDGSDEVCEEELAEEDARQELKKLIVARQRSVPLANHEIRNGLGHAVCAKT